MKLKLAAISMIITAGCQQQPANTQNEAASTPPAAPPVPADSSANETPTNAGAGASEVTATAPPPDRKVLSEPKGPIDPKSAEAAGQVVQHYGALIEQSRFNEAAATWGDKNAAAAFAKELEARGLKHLEIGDLSDPEGAAGSIYITMPVVFYQDAKRSPATITLRRVNDVDGSTAAQRRWHIERIEWGKR